ncbi:hypothetical protein QR685DRAFT_516094 [Neurospora intermedia]|uniref:Secreted protein n=1 Tax=Neurospora intermedia TaxID=5142 RepID=A0ABR3DLM4_NEUIN
MNVRLSWIICLFLFHTSHLQKKLTAATLTDAISGICSDDGHYYIDCNIRNRCAYRTYPLFSYLINWRGKLKTVHTYIVASVIALSSVPSPSACRAVA